MHILWCLILCQRSQKARRGKTIDEREEEEVKANKEDEEKDKIFRLKSFQKPKSMTEKMTAFVKINFFGI